MEQNPISLKTHSRELTEDTIEEMIPEADGSENIIQVSKHESAEPTLLTGAINSTPSERPIHSGPLSEESLKALEELGLVLKTIYLRMRQEGYRIVDGKMVKMKEYENTSNKGNNAKGDSERHVP